MTVSVFLVSPLSLQGYSIDCPSIVHQSSIETMDHRWSIDGVSMEHLRRKSGVNTLYLPFSKGTWDKRKRPDSWLYAQKSDLRHILLMSVGSLFAIFCLLFGRTRTVSSSYVFLFLCLGLDLPVILLWLGASAGE